jgi:hypothetical protein
MAQKLMSVMCNQMTNLIETEKKMCVPLKINFLFLFFHFVIQLSLLLTHSGLPPTDRTHEKLADLIEGKLEDVNVWQGAKYAPDVSTNQATFLHCFLLVFFY